MCIPTSLRRRYQLASTPRKCTFRRDLRVLLSHPIANRSSGVERAKKGRTHVNNEFTNINNEIFTLKGNLTRMEDWQHNLQTNLVNKYENWVDNTGDMDFDLELGNVDLDMADDPNVRDQEEEEEEEEETEMMDEQ
jgi:hypothetical protein